jgi:hypothetical protein
MSGHPLTGAIPAPLPRVFQYSLDWRFLLPARDPERLYVLFEPDAEFSQTLAHVGIPASQHLSLADFKQSQLRDVQSLVLPFGLPARGVDANPGEQIELYAFARNRMAPGGYLLVGFDHRWNRPGGAGVSYRSATPRRVRDQLQKAGFSSVKLFGVLPNLRIPEYIFDLDSRTIGFALRNRFRRKPAVVRGLRLLAATAGLARLTDLLPCYFAVATA